MTRRELLALASTATLVRAKDTPAPVAIARCAYDEDVPAVLRTMFDQLGLDRVVANKTITIKLNLTGSPRCAFRASRSARRTTRIRGRSAR